MRGERILLTGGTGFFGCWLVESFLHANRTLGLKARIAVLSRRPRAFAERAPHLCADAALDLLEGDVRSFALPPGQFACILHAATDTVAPASTSASAGDEYSTIVEGARHVLEVAERAGARRLLLASSGAVYGPQPVSISHVDEEQPFAPSESAYVLGKRAAEALCREAGLDATIARGFAFLGPHLRLDAHFAAGNFLRDALEARSIAVSGDGTPLRSYLYGADLVIWLWTILLKGQPGRAYNVGSEDAVSIAELARRTAAGAGQSTGAGVAVRIAQQPASAPVPPVRYVPSTQRAQSELGLATWIGLDDAVQRTLAWHRTVTV